MKRRAYSIINVKAVEEADDEYVITGMATTPTPDRIGDVVDPLGASFAEQIPLLWQHQAAKPVGLTKLGRPTKKGIPFTARLPKVKEAGALKERIDEAIQSVKYKLVAAVSIGFRVLQENGKYAMEYIEETGGIKFLKTEIMELSLVTIPANADATIATVKSLDTGLSDSDESEEAASGILELVTRSGATESRSINQSRKEKPKVKIKEMLAAAEAKRAAHAARMQELMSKAAEEGVTLSGPEEEEYDTLSGEVQDLDKHIKRLRDLEKVAVEEATVVRSVTTPGEGSALRGTSFAAGRDVLPKGMEFARFVRCLVMAKGNAMQALEIAKANFKDNHRLITSLKSAVAGGTTTDPTWAAPLVEYTTMASEFIDFLRPQTIIGKFGTNGIPSLRRIPFNVRMGRQTSGGNGYWVGEGKPKPLTKFDFDEVTLRWAKVANIAVLTDELIRFSNPAADTIVQQALADALRERMDIDFIDPDKAEVSNVSPASITNGVVGITASGTDADAVRADIEAVMGNFIAANLAPTSGVWIMSTTNALALSLMQNALGQPVYPNLTMNGGTFAGLPVITSEYVTQVADSAGSPIILVNADDVYLADDGGVTIDASREASLQMLDNPTNDATDGTATAMVSMFQTNSVALRAERVINWKKRRSAAVQMIVAAAYSSASTT